MSQGRLFEDYYWKGGSPKGVRPSKTDTGYKIVSDPYHRYICVEKYVEGRFIATVYDSVLLDFRRLRPAEHTAWQREPLREDDHTTEALLRNQDDRVLFKETCLFEQGFCRKCQIHSIHGILLSVHHMFYTQLQDACNEVILYDSNSHPVMYKRYAADPVTGDFTDLLEENWSPVEKRMKDKG